MADKNWCCWCDDGGECRNDADYEIWYGKGKEDVTHACTGHVGHMLEPGVENRVFEITND